MCCCGKPVINGETGYKWQPNDAPSIRLVNPPELQDGDQLLLDLPGRCGGLDSHSHHYRVVKRIGWLLLVRHGGGDEAVRLSGPLERALKTVSETDLYWLLNAIYHAYSDGKHEARSTTAETWRKAAAEKRIKTRKQRGSNGVKVWIEHADVTDMRNAQTLNRYKRFLSDCLRVAEGDNNDDSNSYNLLHDSVTRSRRIR